jgi:hypothetical protein
MDILKFFWEINVYKLDLRFRYFVCGNWRESLVETFACASVK